MTGVQTCALPIYHEQELNYVGICRAIVETGYDLYVGHEFRPKGDPMETLETTYKMCAI